MPTEMIIDTDNRFTWSSKTSVTDADGKVLLTTIDYDNGTTLTRDYEQDITMRTDPLDTQSWVRIEEENAIYGLSGSRKRTITYEDGNQLVETFRDHEKRQLTYDANGLLKQDKTSLYDADNTLSSTSVIKFVAGERVTGQYRQYKDGDLYAITDTWAESHPSNLVSRVTLLNPEGHMESRETHYQDGTYRVEEYEAGQRVRMEMSDTGDVTAWSTIVRTYDADGATASQVTVYDDGRERTEIFENGERVSWEDFDPNAPEPWPRVEETFDTDGNIATRVTDYENGSRLEETFNVPGDGYKQEVFTDADPASEIASRNSFLYRSVEDPDVYERVFPDEIVYKDGRVETFDALQGFRVIRDVEDVYPWAQYDEDLILHERYGNGPDFVSAWNRTYDDGSSERWWTTSHHVEELAGRHSYQKIDATGATTFFQVRQTDNWGNLIALQTETQTGDGSFSEVWDSYYYTDGVITSAWKHNITQGDTPWEAQQKLYSISGDLLGIETYFWDGRKRTDEFDNGTLTARIHQDLNDEKPWTSIFAQYNPDGSLFQREIIHDNGVTTYDFFDAGQRVARQKLDTEDQKSWDETLQTYDTFGDLLQTKSIMDDGDVIVHLAEQNTRVYWDGNDSSSWAFKVTEVDENNVKTVTTYDSYLETPPEYVGLFELS